MKVSEMQIPALNWAVAKCYDIHWEQGDLDAGKYGPGFDPADNWADGGPIIEREGISLRRDERRWIAEWWAPAMTLQELRYARHKPNQYAEAFTPLIAAMRCFVMSRMGSEIDIPEELQ